MRFIKCLKTIIKSSTYEVLIEEGLVIQREYVICARSHGLYCGKFDNFISIIILYFMREQNRLILDIKIREYSQLLMRV